MENSAKVFSSDITRVCTKAKNNLNELLTTVPAKSIKLIDKKIYTCDYSPKTGKYYIPKNKSGLKVKTVRDIRKSFEQNVYSHLISDLETQQNVILQKIRRGLSKDDNTKKIATKILRGDKPISRSTWQMLINLNPENQNHPRQFVLWKGKLIQVKGSFGGIKKRICNFDLASMPKFLPTQNYKKKYLKQHEGSGKKSLLRSSLAVKFKPGPLCKKQFLDNSYKKYHIGNIELINLPKLGLDVQPEYGTAVEPSITHFVNNLREEDGTISRKWAELAVSVLGTVKNSKVVQINRDCITFDLAYENNQSRLLMCRGVDNYCNTSEIIGTGTLFTKPRKLNVQLEKDDKVHKIIDAVEKQNNQDAIFTQEQELKKLPCEDLYSVSNVTPVKDKSRIKFSELDRMDVNTFPQTEEHNLIKSCSKMACSFGCICETFEGNYNLKQHCGREECMFKCECDFTKYKSHLSYTGSTEQFPRLLSIDNKMNSSLAKEEQIFYETGIVSDEKTILGERNWKTSKKYANTGLKHDNQKIKNLSIVALKLNCDNVEPWCMVHELYKCFCKGKFTETWASVSNVTNIEERERREGTNSKEKFKISDKHIKPNTIHTSRRMGKTANTNKKTEKLNYSDPEDKIQINHIVKDAGTILKDSSDIISMNAEKDVQTNHMKRKFKLQQYSDKDSKNNDNNEKESDSEDSDYLEFWDSKSISCSRTSAYEGRKHSKGYYKKKNDKISTVEEKNKLLQERLSFLHNKSQYYEEDTIIKPTNKTIETPRFLQLLSDTNKNLTPNSKRRCLSNNTNLRTWLESSIKLYRQQNDSGLFKNVLEPPQHGKVTLHSWDFILKRYQERKSLFLVSQQPPFRIFMAVNHTENPFFENCIDVNDIRYEDLHTFPIIIKNLLVSTPEFKDNFCILRGLAFCWELIGFVNKINKKNEDADAPDINKESSNMNTLSEFNQNNSLVNQTTVNHKEQKDVFNQANSKVNNLLFKNTEHTETIPVLKHNLKIKDSLIESTQQKNLDKIGAFNQNNSTQKIQEQKDNLSSSEKEFESSSDDAGSSKWFVMTLENDFSEIRFIRKGFFVKYVSIVNAINVARTSGKTVRLSSKKCIEQPEAPPFGIYAIPNDKEYCVFVGPYGMDDTLGIETILEFRRLKRTRGFWITTKKIDNLKLVENPLSFALTNSRIKSLPSETHFYANGDQAKRDTQESLDLYKTKESKVSTPPKKDQIKVVKHIEIRKTKGFYHSTSAGDSKKISLQYPPSTITVMPVVVKTPLNMQDDSAKSIVILKPTEISNDFNLNQIPETSQRPYAEASSSASQIKIPTVFSIQNADRTAKRTNHEGGMYILRPEEINRKLVKTKLTENTLPSTDEFNDGQLNLQSGLENVTIKEQRSVSDNEWYSLTTDTSLNCNLWKDVWIECENIQNLGWIAGKKDSDNLLRFKIPGCEYTDFCTEEETFAIINSELRKRINSLNDFEIEWKVHESIDQLQGQEMNTELLHPDFIPTPKGQLHTSEKIKSNKDNFKIYSRKQAKGKGRGKRTKREIVKVGDEHFRKLFKKM